MAAHRAESIDNRGRFRQVGDSLRPLAAKARRTQRTRKGFFEAAGRILGVLLVLAPRRVFKQRLEMAHIGRCERSAPGLQWPRDDDRRSLTPREREVLALMAAGKTNGEISRELAISFPTAKAHVSSVLSKFGLT